jgi:hypothetical protein
MIGQTWIFVNMMMKTELQKKKESKLSKSNHLFCDQNGQKISFFYFFVIEIQLQHGPRCPIGAKTKSTQSQSCGDQIPF